MTCTHQTKTAVISDHWHWSVTSEHWSTRRRRLAHRVAARCGARTRKGDAAAPPGAGRAEGGRNWQLRKSIRKLGSRGREGKDPRSTRPRPWLRCPVRPNSIPSRGRGGRVTSPVASGSLSRSGCLTRYQFLYEYSLAKGRARRGQVTWHWRLAPKIQPSWTRTCNLITNKACVMFFFCLWLPLAMGNGIYDNDSGWSL
jgi:hypothetical protein